MKVTHPTWILALLGLLVSQVMAFPSEMQSDDENILQDVLNQYIKPYVEPVMDRVKDSPLYTSFTNMMDNVTEAKDKALYNIGMLSVVFIWGPLHEVNRKIQPIRDFAYNMFWEKNEQ
ncbi:hypothetical protein XELAEV_18036026mg [Xenopus laevis]|nr:hypothetical protein XELAEV_18036026mg [Xenopus laevis]